MTRKTNTKKQLTMPCQIKEAFSQLREQPIPEVLGLFRAVTSHDIAKQMKKPTREM